MLTIFLDAYIEIKGSSCRRRLRGPWGIDRKFIKQNAKDECSKNRRCIGIVLDASNNNVLCLDSVHRNTAWDEYGKLVKQVFRKAKTYGKCTSRKST